MNRLLFKYQYTHYTHQIYFFVPKTAASKPSVLGFLFFWNQGLLLLKHGLCMSIVLAWLHFFGWYGPPCLQFTAFHDSMIIMLPCPAELHSSGSNAKPLDA